MLRFVQPVSLEITLIMINHARPIAHLFTILIQQLRHVLAAHMGALDVLDQARHNALVVSQASISTPIPAARRSVQMDTIRILVRIAVKVVHLVVLNVRIPHFATLALQTTISPVTRAEYPVLQVIIRTQ